MSDFPFKFDNGIVEWSVVGPILSVISHASVSHKKADTLVHDLKKIDITDNTLKVGNRLTTNWSKNSFMLNLNQVLIYIHPYLGLVPIKTGQNT